MDSGRLNRVERWWIVLASAMMFFALSLWWSYQAFLEEYSVDTNYCQYAQGRLFAQGVVWGRGKEFRGLSSMWTCMLNVPLKGSASKYPPGYSGLITIAWSLGSTRVLNPLCGALTLALVMLTTMRVYGSRLVTGWFVALSFLSVYFVHMSAEFWNHPSALLACAAIVWSVSRERGREVSSFITLGLAIVFCILTRPLSGIAMAIFVGGVGVVRWKRGDGSFVRPVAMIVGAGASTVLGVVLLGAYNQILTGSAFVSGYEMLHGTPHNPGFHVDPYGRNFTAWVALHDIFVRWRSLNVWLFMWPIPSLTLLAVWCVSYRRWVRGDGFFVWWVAVQSFVYCYMWSAGQVQYGPRFLYEALPAVVVLSARGAAILEEALLTSALQRAIFRGLIAGCSAFGFWRYAHVVGVLS